MHPLVRDCYKRLIFAGREYPGGLDAVRERIRDGFRKNAEATSERELKRAVAYGRFMAKEMHAVHAIKKYRVMKERYYN